MVDAEYEHGLSEDEIGVWKAIFERQRAFGEHAFGQLDDERFFRVPGPGLNSVGVIARHMGGNMRSRWVDFLTSDGEKPARDRDAELAPFPEAMNPKEQRTARAQVMGEWGSGWEAVFATIDGLGPEDLVKTVTVRSVEHSVIAAVVRQLDHYAFHVGQINVIARLLVGTDSWEWFTLAPGGTSAFNKRLMGDGPRGSVSTDSR